MARKHNIIVVGSGLFGCIAAAWARKHGHNVTVISEKRPFEASPASGCVLATSWLSSLDKDDVDDALKVLYELYPIHDIAFKANKLLPFKAKRVNPADILHDPDFDGKVLSVGDGVVKFQAPDGTINTMRGTVLVCAGIWCKELVKDMPDVKGLYGASLRLYGQKAEPTISVYAPYKQAVMFNVEPKTVWFGDGSALIEKTWMTERKARIFNTQERFAGMLDVPNTLHKMKVTEGARPYVEGHKSGYLKQISPKLWVSTGGAKNGTVLAALQALRFVEGLK